MVSSSIFLFVRPSVCLSVRLSRPAVLVTYEGALQQAVPQARPDSGRRAGQALAGGFQGVIIVIIVIVIVIARSLSVS